MSIRGSISTPLLTVDIIIKYEDRIVLIKRKNPPYGWALPGGFVDIGETVEQAAAREAKEETSLDLINLAQFKVYSEPSRDPRGHTVSVVFTADGTGIPKADDDAKELKLFSDDNLPPDIAFDHGLILSDFFSSLK